MPRPRLELLIISSEVWPHGNVLQHHASIDLSLIYWRTANTIFFTLEVKVASTSGFFHFKKSCLWTCWSHYDISCFICFSANGRFKSKGEIRGHPITMVTSEQQVTLEFGWYGWCAKTLQAVFLEKTSLWVPQSLS